VQRDIERLARERTDGRQGCHGYSSTGEGD
jgi:hypothetical protein